MKHYTIETHRRNTRGLWLTLGSYSGDLETARSIAQDMAIELKRAVRVVTYAKEGFSVRAEFSDEGRP